MRNVLLLSFLCAGCTFSVRGLSVGDDGGGVDGGGEDGPTSCDPGGSQNHCSADGTAILACAPDGTTFNPQPCNFGCAGPTGAPHCALLVPSGVVLTTDYRMPSAQMITISSDTVFHVDDGSITGGVTRAAGGGVLSGIYYREATQVNGPNVGIFGFGGLTIAAGAHVSFVGTDAVAFVSSKDVSIAGAISLVGDCSGVGGGPGGASGAKFMDANGGNAIGSGGGKAGTFVNPSAAGGGGGGYGEHGGKGSEGGGSTAGAGGTAFGDLTLDTLILAGGGGGGAGAHNMPNMMPGAGGGGGGALQISVAGALTLAGGGVIDAGGCGGFGGVGNAAGGGGGAGGAILLEAAQITLDNLTALWANGGGGGGGDGGNQGTSGAIGGSSGLGGTTSGGAGVGGANGGVTGAIAGANGPPLGGTEKAGGGGGGGVGRIAIKTMNGTGLTDLGCAYSPDVSDKNANGAHPTTLGAASFK